MSASVLVDCGGFRLAAEVSGAPEGAPWLVLSNSLGASRAMWAPQLAWLGRRFRVLGYDQRGHGESDAPAGPYGFDDLTGDVIALMDHFGVGTASFMGLSLGGMTGLGLALRHPSRFDRVVCCDARADAPPAYVQGWTDRIAAVRAGGMGAILAGTMERWFVPQTRDARPDLMAAMQAMFMATSPAGYIGCAEALKRLDYLKDLPGLSIPALYVVGDSDLAAPPATMRAMADVPPGSRYAEIPRAAHLANIDNPADFASAVGPFLGLA
jgi:3-oxoadipate enol-lactonase